MAQLCRYFQRGTCNFGSNCRYIHPGQTTQASSNSSSYSAGGAFGGTQTKLEGVTIPSAEAIKTDLIEKPIWVLSSYGPGKDPPAQLIDGKDVSFEETRLMAYTSLAEGTPAVYESEWQRLNLQAESQIQNILNDLPGAIQFLRGAQENKAASFRYNTPNDSTSSVFGALVTQPSTSAFGAPAIPSVFGQPSQLAPAFGASSALGNRLAPAFGQSTFGQPPAPAFGQPAFGQTSQPQSAFGNPAFGQPSFGQPAFGQSAFSQTSAMGAASTAPAFVSAGSAPSPFAQAANPPAFGQSAFGQPSQLGNAPSPFSSAGTTFNQNQGAPNPFASVGSTLSQNQGTQNPFSAFQPSQNAPASTMQQDNPQSQPQPEPQSQTSAFSNLNPFQQGQQAQNPFKSSSQTSQAPPVFGQQTMASPFASAAQAQQPRSQMHQMNPGLQQKHQGKKWDDPVIEYLPPEKDSFAAPQFKLGMIPLVAPSKQMCWGT